MSDPVTNSEIEDVLSSIRRLVSQDSRLKQDEAVQRQALVLTEAQRVEEQAAANAAAASEVEKAAGRVARSELERAIEELEETMGLGESGTDSEADAAGIDWDAPVGRHIEGPPPASSTEPDTGAGRSAATARPSTIDSLQSVSQAAKPASDSYDEHYEGDVLADAHLEFEEDAPMTAKDARPRGREPLVLDARHAESAAQKDSGVDTTPEPFGFDEDMLRDMVAEIVRSELQGELGERITRNVRKLVRREVNRALAGQELI